MEATKIRLSDFLRSATDVAVEHVAADRACGREWVCACAACRATRATMKSAPKIAARVRAAERAS